jgi:hypothetical protein
MVASVGTNVAEGTDEIPAQAGIQYHPQRLRSSLDPRLRGDFERRVT